jgi:hypothetical protein
MLPYAPRRRKESIILIPEKVVRSVAIRFKAPEFI